MNILEKQIMEINQLCNESKEIYHSIAQKYGISDSVFEILYGLYHNETAISQTEICNDWFYSRQTVNSAISSMRKKGWIQLETIPGTRNRKNIVLTQDGKTFCCKILSETNEIEQATYSKLTNEERLSFISIFKKVNQYMKEEYKKNIIKKELQKK